MESGAAPAAVVSKSAFAGLIGVSPGRVSQYIAEKKLTGEALDGEGREQRIVVAEACRQLKRKLDIGQRLGNGLGTRLDQPAVLPLPEPPDTQPKAPAAPPPPAPDGVEEQIKRARLAQIEFANRKAAEEEAARAGGLTDAEFAKAEMGKIGQQMMVLFESALTDFATALAAKFQIQQRDALHLLRSEFRRVRTNAATTLKDQAGLLPDVVAFEIEEPAPPAET